MPKVRWPIIAYAAAVLAVGCHSSVPGAEATGALGLPTPASLTVTEVAGPPSGPSVMLQQRRRDETGPTSMRYYAPRSGPPTKTDAWVYGGQDSGTVARYYYRDRDLGQTFTTGDEGFRLGAITVRLQPVDVAGADPSGARVSLQLFRVEGAPRVEDNGTRAYRDAAQFAQTSPNGVSVWRDEGGAADTVTNPRWSTYAAKWPVDTADASYTYRWPVMHLTDDYLVGERFVPVALAEGGVVPDGLDTDDYLRWDIGPGEGWDLDPRTRYAWVFLFDEPAAAGVKRNLPLSNFQVLPGGRGTDAYPGGHQIRRDGATTALDEVFIRDTADVDDLAASRRSASFPVRPDGQPDRAARLAIPPGTLGYPDVDTYRDLWFVLERED